MKKIPVVLSTDENYAPYCATTIASVLENSEKNTEFDFYILTAKLSKETKGKFQDLKKIKNYSINFVSVNKDLFRDCPVSYHFTREAYFRFKLPSLLPGIDKIMYLDCDMIVFRDLSELFQTDINNYYAGMVLDASTKLSPNANQERLELPENSSYFNTGLIIINLKKWREEKIEQKLFEWTKENKERIIWVEQDAVNVVFHGFIRELPEEYNIQLNYYNNREILSNLVEKMHIIHYCGLGKPWNNKEMFLSEYFWEYAKTSPFYDEIREKYLLNYSEMQKSEVDFVKQLIRKYKPKKILEIGVAAGSCSAIMLNEAKGEKDSMVYGIDYNEIYYRDDKRKSGWIVGEVFPELSDKIKIFTGGVAACFLDKIGDNIDFCVIDTMHVLPGELLDFLMVLPYLKENSICVLHDTNLQNLPVENGTIRVSKDADSKNLQFVGNSYATGVLMSILASEKIFPTEYLKDFALPNIMAFKITPDLKKYIQNVFYALALPWKYKLSDRDKKIIGDFIEKHYSKGNADYFYQIAELMRKRIEAGEQKNREIQQEDEELNSIKSQLDSAEIQLDSTKIRLDSNGAELVRIYSSREWKVALILQKIVKIMIPKGSLRRKYLKNLNNKIKFAVFEPNRFINKYLAKIPILFLRKETPPKVLAVINHYYGKSRGFVGKSSFQDANMRRKIVKKAIDELKTIQNIDIKVCGMKNSSLVDIDVDFSHIKDPSFLIYETIEWMGSRLTNMIILLTWRTIFC